MYRTKAIYQLSDLKQSSWKILRLFEIYRQSGSQAPVIADKYFLWKKNLNNYLKLFKIQLKPNRPVIYTHTHTFLQSWII